MREGGTDGGKERPAYTDHAEAKTGTRKSTRTYGYGHASAKTDGQKDTRTRKCTRTYGHTHAQKRAHTNARTRAHTKRLETDTVGFVSRKGNVLTIDKRLAMMTTTGNSNLIVMPEAGVLR